MYLSVYLKFLCLFICVFVYQDFSVQKCIAELAKDPPCDEKALQDLLKQRYEQCAQQRELQAAQAEKRRQIREKANKAVKPPQPETEEEKEKTSSSSQPSSSSTGADKVDAHEKKAEDGAEKAGDRKEEKTAEENEEKTTADAPQTGSEATHGDKQNKEGTEGQDREDETKNTYKERISVAHTHHGEKSREIRREHLYYVSYTCRYVVSSFSDE